MGSGKGFGEKRPKLSFGKNILTHLSPGPHKFFSTGKLGLLINLLYIYIYYIYIYNIYNIYI